MLALFDPVLAIIRFCSRYLQLRADAKDSFDSALFYAGTPASFMISVSSRVRSACRVPVENALISTGLMLNWSTRVRRWFPWRIRERAR